MRMRWFLLLLACFIPGLALATGYVNPTGVDFTPPETDISVKFLSVIFGVVDGVLHGTSSQIMGELFGVFNAGVLALGGIIVMYTLFVSTMNTANEGEILGKRWNSIWIPIRTAGGIALLLPKATGYSLIQIFIMWVVVQGVGLADAMWGKALDYLQLGGVLVQSSISPLDSDDDKLKQTGSILQSEVCLYGIQKLFQLQRQRNADNGVEQDFKNTLELPDSVDIVKTQMDAIQANSTADMLNVQLPNLEVAGPYEEYLQRIKKETGVDLNGICGTISWKQLSSSNIRDLQSKLGLSDALLQRAEQARSIATQQIYLDLGAVARDIIRNSFARASNEPELPLGQLSGGSWVGAGGLQPLLTGYELKNATDDYYGIMRPTLNAIENRLKSDPFGGDWSKRGGQAVGYLAGEARKEASKLECKYQQAVGGHKLKSKGQEWADTGSKDEGCPPRSWFDEAREQGWMLAGSYFFYLAQINKQTGDLTKKKGTVKATAPNKLVLSKMLTTLASKEAGYLINEEDANELLDDIFGSQMTDYIKGAEDIRTTKIEAGQITWHATLEFPNFTLPTLDRQGGSKGIFHIKEYLRDIVWNNTTRKVVNYFIESLNQIMLQVESLILRPLTDAATGFMQYLALSAIGLYSIDSVTTSPILSLAALGNKFINIAGTIWLGGSIAVLAAGAIPLVGQGVTAFMLWFGPLIMAILSMMFVAGSMMAYYLPLLPFMIFAFGALGWFIGVIEAMVAAPIVALGVTYPEGQHEVFGQADRAIMLLFNVFLRPAMMIVGYISGIILSYVGIWVVNLGFGRATSGMIESTSGVTSIIAPFAVIGIYFLIVVSIVQKSFALIHIIPDKVLRWLSGGLEESLGSTASGMEQEIRGGVGSGAGQLAAGASKGTTKKEEGKPLEVKNKSGDGGGVKNKEGGGDEEKAE